MKWGFMSAIDQPPGWYIDPDGLATMRWWDGEQWTDQLAPVAAPASVRRRSWRKGLLLAVACLVTAATIGTAIYVANSKAPSHSAAPATSPPTIVPSTVVSIVTPSPSETADPGEAAFIQAVRVDKIAPEKTRDIPDKSLLVIGHRVCDDFKAGLADRAVQDDVYRWLGNRDGDAGAPIVITIAAVFNLCREYEFKLGT
jgi:hypothetical protein